MVDFKVALITGGTSGIGSAVGQQLSREGYHVVLVGRNEETGNKICKKISDNKGEATFIKCDLMLTADIENLADKIARMYGREDVLFNNAGIMLQSKELENLPLDEWKKTFETNVDSAFLVTKYLKTLVFACKGCIINNASIAGMQSYIAGRSYAYSASKSALIQFSRQMALNYAEAGVRVNCICPGIIDTPILGDRDRHEYAKRVPLGYVGTPEDVANVVAFLASDQASYITGAVIPIDGGVSLS